LIALAKETNEALKRGDELSLNEDELAFYDALETNESAVRELGDEILKKIAQELTNQLRKNTTIDWAKRESVRANLRLMVRRILKKYKYPPDKELIAVENVLTQAETLSAGWV
jgi:type I restriction enzyme R subunit